MTALCLFLMHSERIDGSFPFLQGFHWCPHQHDSVERTGSLAWEVTHF